MAEFSKDRTILMESLKILVTFCRTPSDITMLTNEHVTESVLNVLAVNADQFDYEIMKLCTDVLIPFSLQKSVRPVVLEAGVFTTMIPILPRLSALLFSDLIRQVFLNMLQVILNTVGEDVKGTKLFNDASGVASLVQPAGGLPLARVRDAHGGDFAPRRAVRELLRLLLGGARHRGVPALLQQRLLHHGADERHADHPERAAEGRHQGEGRLREGQRRLRRAGRRDGALRGGRLPR